MEAKDRLQDDKQVKVKCLNFETLYRLCHVIQGEESWPGRAPKGGNCRGKLRGVNPPNHLGSAGPGRD